MKSMTSLIRHTIHFAVLSFTLITGTRLAASVAEGTSENLSSDVEDYLSFLSGANEYSPLEGAGSHGSLGIAVGVGASMHPTPENTEVVNDQLRTHNQFHQNEASANGKNVVVPRAFFHKGLPWPVDFGLGIGQLPNSQATTAGGYVQWTLYEAFAMPAVALRAKRSRLMGLPSTEFDSSSLEGIASYGFLRIFTAYGSYSFNRHSALIRTGGESGTSLALSDTPGEDYQRTFSDQSRTLGVQVQVLPPFCTLGFESRSTGSQSSYLAKISVGM